MLTYPIAAALLLGGSASAALPKSAALRKKLIKKGTFVGGRRLDQDYDNWYDNVMNGNYNYNFNYNQGQAQQANDDAVAEDDSVEEDNAEDDEENEQVQNENGYVFNPSQYALSYHRCAAVRQFDDEVAAREDTNSVFATKNFAVFRFCPAATCDPEIEENGDDDGQGGRRRRRLEDAAYEEGAEQEGGEEEEDDEQEQQELYGARGKGCRKNYGEYMMELEDYLEIMADDQDQRVEEYCEYCEEYMYEIYQNYVDQCMQNYNCRHRNLQYDGFKEDKELHRELGFNFGICEGVPDVCNGALDDSLSEYFKCTEAGDGVYIGPHCSEDGFSVTLATFADEDCNQYLGGDVADYIGQDIDEDNLMNWYNSKHGPLDFLYEGEEESVCIPCAKKVSLSNQRLTSQCALHSDLLCQCTCTKETDFQEMNQDDDANDDQDAEADNGEMSEICETVYESSARCDKNYRSFRQGRLGQEQWKEMQLSCAFIDSVVMGNYDEMGYVNLKNNWNFQLDTPEWARDNQYAQQYGHVVTDVSPLQVFFLVFTILACTILAVWSKTLHSSLIKNKVEKNERDEPWSPGRQWSVKNLFRRGGDKPGISSVESGIGASRVRSDGTSYYLS